MLATALKVRPRDALVTPVIRLHRVGKSLAVPAFAVVEHFPDCHLAAILAGQHEFSEQQTTVYCIVDNLLRLVSGNATLNIAVDFALFVFGPFGVRFFPLRLLCQMAVTVGSCLFLGGQVKNQTAIEQAGQVVPDLRGKWFSD